MRIRLNNLALSIVLMCSVGAAGAVVPNGETGPQTTRTAQAAATARPNDGELRDSELPRWAIKTNLLSDATATFNLGAELRLGGATTLDVPVGYNPWTFRNNRKWKHILVQPEFRLWLDEAFDGHFFGLHAHWAFYNVGNLPHGPFSRYMRDHRFEGWLLGAGVSYGHRWGFRNPRWAIEATLGVGYAYLSYDKFMCPKCGEKLGSDTKHYFGPTKIGVNLIYTFGAGTEK